MKAVNSAILACDLRLVVMQWNALYAHWNLLGNALRQIEPRESLCLVAADSSKFHLIRSVESRSVTSDKHAMCQSPDSAHPAGPKRQAGFKPLPKWRGPSVRRRMKQICSCSKKRGLSHRLVTAKLVLTRAAPPLSLCYTICSAWRVILSHEASEAHAGKLWH